MSKKRSPDRDDAAADSDHDSDMTVAVIDHQDHYLPPISPRISVPTAAALGISHLEPHPVHSADAEHNAPYVSLAGQRDQPQRNPDCFSLDNDTASSPPALLTRPGITLPTFVPFMSPISVSPLNVSDAVPAPTTSRCAALAAYSHQ
jgi:hypothetical protein